MADEWSQFPDAESPAVAQDSFAEFPDATPTALPAPPPGTYPEKSLKEVIGEMFSAPGRQAVTAGTFAGGVATGDIFSNPEAYLQEPTQKEVAEPLVSPETATDIVSASPLGQMVKGGKEGLSGAIRGIFEGIGTGASSLTSPSNLALLPFLAPLGAARGATRILQGLFEGQAILGTPDQIKAFREAPDAASKAKIGTEMALGLLAPIAPEVAPLLKRTGQEIPKTGEAEIPPAAPEAAVPAASAEDYVPALRTKEGQIIAGERGQIHQDIYNAQPDPMELRANEPEHGFVNKNNEFSSREEVSSALGEETPMQSERLRELQQSQPLEAHAIADEAGTKPVADLSPVEAAQPEAVREGVVPAERVVEGSTNPEQASLVSAQALGVTHPMPGFIRSIADYFVNNTPSQIWNTVKGSVNSALGKTFSKTTIADRASGELAARWISARTSAPYLAETFASNVLGDSGIDPVKFGAALTEDNLRSVRKTALAEGRPEDAGNVTSIIGADNSPFKTEAEYRAFLDDPATQQAIERHRALWQETVDPMFRKAQTLDPDEPLPSRGDETSARVNLYNDLEGKGAGVVSGTAAGNMTATMRKKSPFAIQARGTGQAYNVNYNDMMANTFGRQLEIAAKNDFERQLVESGNAVIGKPGEPPTLPDGEATVGFPLKRKSSAIFENAEGQPQIVPINQNIYVRKSLAGEYRRGADVDLLKVPALVRGFNNVINRAALAGLTDASVHVLNLATALFTRPSVVGSVLTDSLLSATGRADVPFTIAKIVTKATKDNQAQLAELAEIGALRAERSSKNPLANLIQWADKTTRLVLDDAFKKMAEAGLVENTETNRREFVAQVGQYNKRAQGDLRRLARDSGFGPFVTAGTTFNTLGIRTVAGSPGVPATSTMAAAALRANVMSKWIGSFVLTGALNYILTKDKEGGGVMGRPGVPIGRIDTGLDDENGRPLSFPLFDVLGLGRGLRVTGARGMIESQRKGLTLQNSFDAAATDIWNTNISPFTGPVIRFGGVASSGKPLPAINVPRTSPVAPPGKSQTAENLKQAIIDANPVIKSIALSQEPGQGMKAAIRQQVPRLTLQPSQSAEFMSKYPEIVRKAQAREFINDVIGRARKMGPDDQEAFVQEALAKLDPEDQKQAKRTLKYSRIRTGEAGGFTIVK